MKTYEWIRLDSKKAEYIARRKKRQYLGVEDNEGLKNKFTEEYLKKPNAKNNQKQIIRYHNSRGSGVAIQFWNHKMHPSRAMDKLRTGKLEH